MFGFRSLFGSEFDHTLESRINPASGLPMVAGAQIDIAGNMYGFNSSVDSMNTGDGIGIGIGIGWGD